MKKFARPSTILNTNKSVRPSTTPLMNNSVRQNTNNNVKPNTKLNMRLSMRKNVRLNMRLNTRPNMRRNARPRQGDEFETSTVRQKLIQTKILLKLGYFELISHPLKVQPHLELQIFDIYELVVSIWKVLNIFSNTFCILKAS